MNDEDEVTFPASPSFEKINSGFEGNAEEYYKKARDTNLPISERGYALRRICEVATRSDNVDINTRKVALEHIVPLFADLGNQKSANLLTDLLFDSSSEIRTIAMSNVSVFVEKADHKSFETIIYTVAEDLAAANEQPASISGAEFKALQVAAKYLMRTYPSQFFPALFAPSSIAKGSLKWLASNYRTLKLEIFGDGSEDGTKADKALMAALKSASSQLTDTIDKAMLSMDAMTTVVKSVHSVLGICSDLLRTSSEPGVVIVSTALASYMDQGGRGAQGDQPRTPDTPHTEISRRRVDRGSSQISPTTLTSVTRRLSSEINRHDQGSLSLVNRQRPSDTSTAPPQDPGFPPVIPTRQGSTPGTQHQRSSSAPPTPTPAKRTFSQAEMCPSNDFESKRPPKEGNNSKTPSPTHGSQRQGTSAGQSGTESYRSRGGYQGRNFIPGYVPGYRARGGYRRETYRSSYPWRGRQSQWSGKSERGEYQGRSRVSEYPHVPRMNYD